jgi:hypothetical protein
MISMQRFLRYAGDGAAGEGGPEQGEGSRSVAQVAAHVGYDVGDVGIAFEHHQFVDLDAAGAADLAEIVALQVEQHDVFGAFLGVGEQFGAQGPILGRVVAAAPGAGNRPGLVRGRRAGRPGAPARRR